jgi:hypothetical protein
LARWAAVSFTPGFMSALHQGGSGVIAGGRMLGSGVAVRLNFSSQLPLGLLLSMSVPGAGAVGTRLPAGVTAGFGIGLETGVAIGAGLGTGVACGAAVARIDTPPNSAKVTAQAAIAAGKARGIAFIMYLQNVGTSTFPRFAVDLTKRARMWVPRGPRPSLRFAQDDMAWPWFDRGA